MKRALLLVMVLVLASGVSALPSRICYPLSTGLFCFNNTDVSGLSIESNLNTIFPGEGLLLKNGSGFVSVADNRAYWNQAYNWGDHSAAGYALVGSNPFDQWLNASSNVVFNTISGTIGAGNITGAPWLESVPYQSSAAGWTNNSDNITTNKNVNITGTLRVASFVDYMSGAYSSSNTWAVVSLQAASDILTTGPNDDLWLGTVTQAQSNFSAMSNGSLYLRNIQAFDNVSASWFKGYLNASDLQNEPWTAQINQKAGVPTNAIRTNVFDGVRQGGQNITSFDGIDDYVDLGTPYDPSNKNFTACVWFVPSGNGTHDGGAGDLLIGRYNGAPEWGIYWKYETASVVLTARNTTLIAQHETGANVAPVGVSTQVCGIYNEAARNKSLYINGVHYMTNVSAKGSISDGTMRLGKTISSSQTRRAYNGSIVHARVWNRSLSAGEVASEYALGANTPTTLTDGLVLQYCLNCTDPEFSNSTHVFNVLGASRTDQVLAERISAVNASALQVVNNSINVTNKIFATSIFGDSANPNIVLSNANGGYLKYGTNYYQVGSSSLSLATANTNRVTINAVNTTFSNIPVSKNFTLSNETGHAYCVKIVGSTLTATAGGC